VLGGLLGVVVKDFEADGVVVVLPVYLFWLLVVAVDVWIWLLSVFHF
jgi:hypothetical protein